MGRMMGDWNYLRRFREALRGPLDHLYDFSDANLVPRNCKVKKKLPVRPCQASSRYIRVCIRGTGNAYSSLP